jgi:hypothetical protein
MIPAMKRLLLLILTPFALLAGVFDAPAYRPLFKVTGSAASLTVNVGAGSFQDASGAATTVAATTVTIAPNLANHLYLSLFDNTVRVFSRAIDQGGVYLGCAMTDGSGVTNITQPASFPIPKTRLPKLKAKLLHGDPIKWIAIGDSITVGNAASPSSGAGSKRWVDLLFRTDASPATYNFPSIANWTKTESAVGGSSPIAGEAMLSTVVGYTGHLQSGGWAYNRDQYMNLLAGTYDTTLGPSKALQPVPDLVTIEFSNVSTPDYDAVILENMCRQLYELGSEVILVLPNPQTSATNGIYTQTDRIKRLAEAGGATIADMWGRGAFMLAAGQSVRDADGVHPNNAGHAEYAALIRSLVTTIAQDSDRSLTPQRTQYALTNPEKTPLRTEIEFPSTGTGTNAVASSGYWSLKNLMLSDHTTYNVGSGQYVKCMNRGCYDVYIIHELGSGLSATCHLGTAAGNPDTKGLGGSVTLTGSGNMQVVKLFSWSQLYNGGTNSAYDTGKFSMGFSGQFYVDSFTGGATSLPVVGFIYTTPKRDTIPWDGMRFSGTWSEETMVFYSSMLLKVTDTATSYVTIPFSGDFLEVYLSGNANAGLISAYVDGEQSVTTTKVGTGSGQNIWHLTLQPGNYTGTRLPRGFRGTRKIAKIQLTTAGASPAAQDRSLGLLTAYDGYFD